ncbi:hypothetical protein NIES4102_23290 [Chondrocystis sp. NIES-4102]|nr:hypothetical protein NIES4102_23290 [Chondrocystis sp. NIES-4102]
MVDKFFYYLLSEKCIADDSYLLFIKIGKRYKILELVINLYLPHLKLKDIILHKFYSYEQILDEDMIKK